jgi:ectoine hydroxylase-related dioxygenase (phytanoyl-CoA dioxygenase family)
MSVFENYMVNMYENEEELYKLLVNDISSVVNKKVDFNNSLFKRRPADVKMLLQSNQSLFWKIMAYLETFNSSDTNDNLNIEILNMNGIHVIKSFFDVSEVKELLVDWGDSLQKIPELSREMREKALLNRFVFESTDEISYTVGSEYDGKKRVLYNSNKSLPKSFEKLLKMNSFLNTTVQAYYNLQRPLEPNVIMAEHLFAAKYHRANETWHIDNLSDQFKVMVILEDMSADDAPFTYVEKTHKLQDRYRDRYYKMYTMNGMTTQEHNHFEDSFVETALAKKGILKSGDIVLFDSRIHHTATFPKNGGNRKNIMLYYATVPTVKNKFLFTIDKYLNFGLR